MMWKAVESGSSPIPLLTVPRMGQDGILCRNRAMKSACISQPRRKTRLMESVPPISHMGTAAVSYTHLEVYKRQGFEKRLLLGRSRRRKGTGSSRRNIQFRTLWTPLGLSLIHIWTEFPASSGAQTQAPPTQAETEVIDEVVHILPFYSDYYDVELVGSGPALTVLENSSLLQVGETLRFGTDAAGAPIEWVVSRVDENGAYLYSCLLYTSRRYLPPPVFRPLHRRCTCRAR